MMSEERVRLCGAWFFVGVEALNYVEYGIV